ncbi:MAG: hypothetical protein U0W24_02325 [Bacteroidales bacterium]
MIWSAEIKELEKLHTGFKGQMPELEKELEQLYKTDDPVVVLVYSRRSLELMVTELCEKELKRPRKTQPLKGIIDLLHSEEKVPAHIIASMNSLNSLSNFGAHPKEFEIEQVKPVINHLLIILKWYLRDKRIIQDLNQIEIKKEVDRPNTKNRKRIRVLYILILGLILLFSVIYYMIIYLESTKNEFIDKSIAVLPFEDISPNHDQEYFSNGMMVEIEDHLQKIKDLKVVTDNSVLNYKDSRKTYSEIGKELGVSYLIIGKARKAGNIFKISVNLIECETGKKAWNYTCDDTINDIGYIFNIQYEVASNIANALNVQISPEVKQRMKTIPTQNKVAYDLFLKGIDEYTKFFSERDIANINDGINFLNMAIAQDSTFSEAYAALADCYKILGSMGSHYEPNYWIMAKHYVEKTIHFDSLNGRAYSILSSIQSDWEWDRRAAMKSVHRAIQLYPGDKSIIIDLFWQYFFQQDCDSMEHTLISIRKFDPQYSEYQAEYLIGLCRHNLEKINQLVPPKNISNAELPWEVSRLMIMKNYNDALKTLQQNKNRFTIDNYYYYKAKILGLSGKKTEALSWIDSLQNQAKFIYVRPTYFADAYMAIGNEQKAYEYLEKGILDKDPNVHLIMYSQAFFGKQDNPRFKAFQNRIWKN